MPVTVIQHTSSKAVFGFWFCMRAFMSRVYERWDGAPWRGKRKGFAEPHRTGSCMMPVLLTGREG